MLRTLMFAFALGAPGVALADPFPQSALHVEVRSDTGAVVGRVEAVERDAEGRIVAVEISGAEPADAPHAPEGMIAEAPQPGMQRIAERREAAPAREREVRYN